MAFIDFTEIVKQAWKNYDETRAIIRIVEISAKVSTNYVYRITFKDESFIIAKLSYFGKFEHFVEDHTIVNALSNNLPAPFENFLARSLMKGNSLYVHRFQNELLDAWVVFYRPIEIKKRLPKRLADDEIIKLGEQLALLHKACYNTRNTLPSSSKTLKTDIDHLLRELETDYGKYEHRMNRYEIRKQADVFFEGCEKLGVDKFDKIPVFMDWNIGNFSVTEDFKLFSRWDYDWFRVSSRIMDFYFLSRVVSDIGDKTVFSYQIDPLMEDRFILFLKAYHAEYPLTKEEILFMKEAYRFFILNYVIKDGRHFFHEIFATKLMREAYDIYFPSIEKEFNADKILKALNL
jgi:Ser/Thr protein kinase RdoA (MazF antagonist)